MKKCWKCGTTIEDYSVHHINGNREDNKPTNKISLCPRCHNIAEGICSKCQSHGCCHVRKFKDCWRFDDMLPPLYYTEKPISIDTKNSITSDIYGLRFQKRPWTDVDCLLCGEEMMEIGRPNPGRDYVCGICVQYMCNSLTYMASKREKLWKKIA